MRPKPQASPSRDMQWKLLLLPAFPASIAGTEQICDATLVGVAHAKLCDSRCIRFCTQRVSSVGRAISKERHRTAVVQVAALLLLGHNSAMRCDSSHLHLLSGSSGYTLRPHASLLVRKSAVRPERRAIAHQTATWATAGA